MYCSRIDSASIPDTCHVQYAQHHFSEAVAMHCIMHSASYGWYLFPLTHSHATHRDTTPLGHTSVSHALCAQRTVCLLLYHHAQHQPAPHVYKERSPVH
jgi:hypothetical protein